MVNYSLIVNLKVVSYQLYFQFVCLLCVYHISSILYRDEVGIPMLTNPIWQPYFNLYGELFTDREPETRELTTLFSICIFVVCIFHLYYIVVKWVCTC